MSEKKTSPKSMSSVEDSLVRTFLTRTREAQDSTETDQDSGLSTPESYASFDPDTLLWRTSQLLLLTDSTECLDRLPSAGTMQSGRLFPRAPWVRHIHDSGCSLLLTPIASDADFAFGLPDRYARKRPHSHGSLSEQMISLHGLRPTARLLEKIMGFPANWTQSECSAMQSFPSAPTSSDGGF